MGAEGEIWRGDCENDTILSLNYFNSLIRLRQIFFDLLVMRTTFS